jgi:putative transcriptional regulator
MFKASLVQETIDMLERNDYATCEYNGCFDIAARKHKLMLLKVLQNIDSFQIDQAKNLKIISNNLDAHPLVVGIQTRREKLKKGIVYERLELPTVSLETLEELIESGIYPKIYRDKGGLYVEIDHDLLREARKRKGMTQKELAEAVGVNKKMVYEHEKSQIRMLLEIAKRMENILDEKLIGAANPFKKFETHGKPQDKLEEAVGKNLRKLGFETDFVKQAPFDVFAKEKVLLISDVEENRRKMLRRAVNLKGFISVVKKPALLITEKTKEENIFGIPVLQRKELEELESGKDLIKIAKKRKL